MTNNNLKTILNTHLIKYLHNELPLDVIFQQNDFPKNTSDSINEWFNQNLITMIKWPSFSPDLNPIENLWIKLKMDIKNKSPKTLNDLEIVANECWKNITSNFCKELINTMPKRCQKIIKSNGDPIIN